MEKLIEAFNKNKKMIEEAIKLDLKEWDYNFSFQEIINIVEEDENKESEKIKEKQRISYPKNIAVIGKIDPKVLVNLVTKSSKLDVKLTFYLKDKLIATNKALIESLDKVKFQCEHIQNIDDFYKKQNEYDICIYFGNKIEYLNFTKRLNILSIYQNYGEIYIFLENKEFKKEMLTLEKYAYNNDIEIKYYTEYEKLLSEINSIGPVNIVGIYTKNPENAYEIANKIYSENVFINVNLIEKYKFDFDIGKLVLKKKISYK